MSSAGIERGADATDRGDEIGEAFERQVFAVQRNQHGVGGDERVERQQAQGGRAVDEHVVVLIPDGGDETPQPFLAMGQRDQLDLRACQLAIGRNQHEAIDDGGNDERPGIGRGRLRYQGVVNSAARPGLTFQADTAREIALRIDVDEQHPPAGNGQRSRQIDRRRGLADAPFLVGDRNYFRHK